MKAQIEITDEEVVVYLSKATVTVNLANFEDYLVAVNRAPYDGRATETIPRHLPKRKGK